MPSLSADELAPVAKESAGPDSASVRTRVVVARERQRARQGRPNARLAAGELGVHCVTDAEGTALLARAMVKLAFSARAYHRVLKVARTIADLAGADAIASRHVAEALNYRRADRTQG